MINLPKTIVGKQITLECYDASHNEGLKSISINPKIWEFLPRKINSVTDFENYTVWLTDRINNHSLFVYSIINNDTQEMIGSTGFLNYDEINRKIEIGGSWLEPDYWGTLVNTEVKFLLLELCFSEFDLIRVEFRTRNANIRSRKALEKLGAKREGILRLDRINDDGSYLDTYVYSIIKPEWKSLKGNLLAKFS
jgi:N-acetyltransferase